MKRLWGIRHVRWLWLRWRLEQWAFQCAMMGLGLGHPNKSDLDYCDAVWRGEE